jgi:hypothetical protein
MVRGELERSRAAMQAYSAILEAGQLSGFYGKLECLKSISDIQCQTGKPIMMPTASVTKK